jgi:hypothetical protein
MIMYSEKIFLYLSKYKIFREFERKWKTKNIPKINKYFKEKSYIYINKLVFFNYYLEIIALNCQCNFSCFNKTDVKKSTVP